MNRINRMKTMTIVALMLLKTVEMTAQNIAMTEVRQRAVAAAEHYIRHSCSAKGQEKGSKEEVDLTLAGQEKGSKGETDLTLAYTSEIDGVTTYHVFNVAGGGFVIIGGNKAARQVLAYSCEGHFDIDSIPQGMRDLLLSYTADIAACSKANVIETEANVTETAVTETEETLESIAPMLKTKWGQGAPYNALLPDSRLFTGCNATALAQIIRYHEYAKGSGSLSYSLNIAGLGTHTFSASYGNATYDFPKMRDEYHAGEYTEEEGNAVARLMYDAGVAMKMSYGTSVSTSGITKPAYAAAQYLGYDKAVSVENRAAYTDTEWERLIYEELAQRRPVLYSGQSGEEGHAFVVHGYDADSRCFAINWGWEGLSDGYFALSGSNALSNADYTGLVFSEKQLATVGLKPDEGGAAKLHIASVGPYLCNAVQSPSKPSVYYYTADRSIGKERKTYILVRYHNLSVMFDQFKYGIMYEDMATGDRTYQEQGRYELSQGSSFSSYKYITVNSSDLKYNGRYRAIPVCRRIDRYQDKDWQPVELPVGQTYTVMEIKGGEDNPTGITAPPSAADEVKAIYSPDGRRLSKPGKGINIFLYSDGRRVKRMM